MSVNGTTMNLICDDYTKDISIGQTWSATLLSGTDISSMKFAGNTTFGNGAANAIQYVPGGNLLSSQSGNSTSSSTIAAIHYGIWTILNVRDRRARRDRRQLTAYWLNLASTNYSSVNLADYSVYLPNPVTSSQEFIGVNQSPVPIPPSVLLMAPGLIGIVGLRKRFNGGLLNCTPGGG